MGNNIIKNNSGITILEVVVAILIITIGLVGVSSLVIQNIEAQYINKNILIASGLAQEGLELARNTRDLNWLTPGNAWNQDIISGGAYMIDYRGRSGINEAAGDSYCGEGICDSGETEASCPADCPSPPGGFDNILARLYVNGINDTGTRLYIDGNGFYTHESGGNTATNFYRLITAVDHADYIDLKSSVRWIDRGQNHDYAAETYLYDWR